MFIEVHRLTQDKNERAIFCYVLENRLGNIQREI